MCDICLALRPYSDDCPYTMPDSSTESPPALVFDPQTMPGYGETWAEWIEAPSGPHGFFDRGYMTVNSTFDGGIGFLGDSDWIRIDFVEGTTYSIQMYSFSMETYLALADDTGSVLTFSDYEIVNYLGIDYAVATLEVTATRTGTYFLIGEESGHDGTGAYTIGVTELAPPDGGLKNWSLDDIAHRLTDSGWEFFGGTRRAWGKDEITYDVSELTADAQVLAKHAFKAWSNATGLEFTKVSGGADIVFSDDDPGKAYANSEVNARGIIQSAIVNIAADFADRGTTLDSYMFQTFIHEIGHVLGLAHAGDYNAGEGAPTTYPDSVLYLNDSWNRTIMSYINQRDNTNDKADYALVMTPMIADMIAVHDLYGAPAHAYAGNTRYGKDSNTGDYMDIVFDAMVEGDTSSPLIGSTQTLSFTIYDTDGKDTIDFSTDTSRQKVDLRSEKLSDIYGVKGAMVIARDTVIETYIAGSNDDKVTGNSAKNKLFGMDGADKLKGLKGNDILMGGAGNDLLIGGKGLDKINGGAGQDTIKGGNGADTFVFGVGAGRDLIKGFKDNGDTLQLDDALWTGDLSKAQVLARFGSDTAAGAVLDFGGGDEITVKGMTLDDLQNDLTFV